ncbi:MULTISPECIES: hypothetical protein [Ferrimicrobium]|uniref:hypothetical protein n=1 Tax=Ferrimicrobium TaxID=121038 RepID=UPI0023EF8B7D|nr:MULTISPECIES: hypothetical protein [Ferrimicrobium]
MSSVHHNWSILKSDRFSLQNTLPVSIVVGPLTLEVDHVGFTTPLEKSRAESDRELNIYNTITTTMVDEISTGSRAKIAVKIGQELGIPPLWVYNPDAYVTEIAGNQKMLIEILGKYGPDFAMVADQFDLSRNDFLRIFSGLQQKVVDVASESTSTPR